MDSRVTAENHPDDPFGMGTGPTYADRSFGPNQEVIARHNLRPLPWPRSVDLEDEVAELLYHFGIDDDWGPLREDRGRMVRCGPSHWARYVMRACDRSGFQDGISVERSELERLIKFLKVLKRSKAVEIADAARIMGPGDRTLPDMKRLYLCHVRLVEKGLRSHSEHIVGGCHVHMM